MPTNFADSVSGAKEEFAASADVLVDAIKAEALGVVRALAAEIRASTHNVTSGFAGDVHQVSDAVIQGLRDVRTELDPSDAVRAHPWAWMAGSACAGAFGYLAARTFRVAFSRPDEQAASSRSVVRTATTVTSPAHPWRGKVAAVAAEAALAWWMSQRKGRLAPSL